MYIHTPDVKIKIACIIFLKYRSPLKYSIILYNIFVRYVARKIKFILDISMNQNLKKKFR